MECFKIYSNEIEGRIDPHYYEPEFRKLELQLRNTWIVPFGELIENMINGLDYRDFSEDGLFYIRVSNIKPFDFDLADVKKINVDYDGFSKNIRLRKGDILLTRKGTFGVALSVKKDSGFIISSEVFRIILKPNINSGYIEVILNSNICQRQFNKHKIGAIMGSLSQEAVKQINIPLPPLEIQNHIVELMDKAHSQKKQKEAEAQQLLDSINDYVLDELGIKLPELKDKMFYSVDSEEVKNKRADPYFYQPKFEEVEKAIERGKFEVAKLEDSFEKNFIKGVSPSEEEKEGDAKVLQIKNVLKNGLINTSEYVTAKNIFKPMYKIQKEEIIIVITGATIGKVGLWYLDEEFYLGGDMIKFSVNNRFNPCFIQAFLLSQIGQHQLMREITGATNKHLSPENIKNIRVSIPPLEVQNKIAEEVKARLEKAKQLQEEAKTVLEEAKEKVERIVLGSEEI